MNLERLAEYFPQLPLGMLLGLILSICFRRRTWAPLVWIPTLVTFLSVAWFIFLGMMRLGSLRGIDSGWGGMEIIFLLPIFGVCIAGVIACYFCRPRGRWDPRASVPAIIISIASLAYCYWGNESRVEVRLTDIQGRQIPGVSIAFNSGPRNPGSSTLKFRLRRQQSLEVQIIPVSDSPSEADESPASSTLRFSTVHGDSSKLRIRYTFSRRIGFRHSLAEDFTEIVPFRRELKIPLVLPPRGSLDPDLLRSKIRSAFHAINREPGHWDLSYGDVCWNLEAIEFLPELIDLSNGSRAQQFSVMEGLKAIAGTLTDVDEGCRELRADIVGRTHPPHECHEKVRQLCVWAEIPEDGLSDSQALDQVQARIAAHARMLVDFCLQDPQDSASIFRPPGILQELGELNRPHLSDFVQGLLAKPPADMQSALSWSSVFHRMRARKSELKELIESPDPLLQAAARDAKSD